MSLPICHAEQHHERRDGARIDHAHRRALVVDRELQVFALKHDIQEHLGVHISKQELLYNDLPLEELGAPGRHGTRL